MPAPYTPLRKALVNWLYSAALLHLFISIFLTWAGQSGLLDGYLQTVEYTFWTDPVPNAARAQQVWWLALFGATLQSYSLYMLALVHLGDRLKIPMAWGWLIAGIVLWAPQDILISAQVQLWSHLWFDSFALLTLLPPLCWLYWHDRRAATSKNLLSDANHA
ncbi:cell division protein [Pseudomonas yamanorum]